MAQTPATANLSWDDFFSTTLSSSISSADTTIPLAAAPTATEGYLVIEPDSATNREIIHFTSVSSNNVILSAVGDRGLGGTTAQAHSSGVIVKMNTVGEMFKDLQNGKGLSTSAIATAKIATSAVTADKIADSSHVLSYTEGLTTGQSTTSAAYTDATGITMTFTTPASSTKILLRAEGPVSGNLSGTVAILAITDSSNVIQKEVSVGISQSNAAHVHTFTISRRITVTASTSYTFKLRFHSDGANTIVINNGNSSDRPTAIWAEKA